LITTTTLSDARRAARRTPVPSFRRKSSSTSATSRSLQSATSRKRMKKTRGAFSIGIRRPRPSWRWWGRRSSAKTSGRETNRLKKSPSSQNKWIRSYLKIINPPWIYSSVRNFLIIKLEITWILILFYYEV